VNLDHIRLYGWLATEAPEPLRSQARDALRKAYRDAPPDAPHVDSVSGVRGVSPQWRKRQKGIIKRMLRQDGKKRN